MARIIINHTNPNQPPVTGDWIEIQEGNSSIKKQYWEAPTLTAEEIATELAREMRVWRDEELRSSDWISQTPDHPQRSAYITYRTALRNWPSTGDFPATKPVLG